MDALLEASPQAQKHAAAHQPDAERRLHAGQIRRLPAEVLRDQDRQQGEGWRQGDLDHHRQGRQRQQPFPAEQVAAGLAQVGPDRRRPVGGAAGRALRLGDAHHKQGQDGQQGRAHVQQHDLVHGGEGQQQRAQRRADDIQRAVEGLVDPGDTGQMLMGHHQRGGSLHGRPVEDAAQFPRQHDHVHVPDLHLAGPEQKGQPQRDQGDQAIGDDHDGAPVPAVDVGAGDRPQHDLRQHGEKGGQRQHRGRAGRLRHPPDQGEHRNPAAQERQRLAAPDGEERCAPGFGRRWCSSGRHGISPLQDGSLIEFPVPSFSIYALNNLKFHLMNFNIHAKILRSKRPGDGRPGRGEALLRPEEAGGGQIVATAGALSARSGRWRPARTAPRPSPSASALPRRRGSRSASRRPAPSAPPRCPPEP